MRIGFTRTDIGPLYIDDIENRSQRNFSSEPRGQSRYFARAASADLEAALDQWAILSARATDVAATVDTSVNDTLRIRQNATDAWTTITVTSGAGTAKTTIRDDLNAVFQAPLAPLPFIASIVGTNQIQIDTVATDNSGPSARLEIDTNVASTLNNAIGYAAGGVILTGLTVAALEAAIYPGGTVVDVSAATINALSTFADLTAAQQALIRDGDNENGIADVAAPRLVETGLVLRSFAYGVISQLRSATFQPGGTRIGLPAGAVGSILEDDGVTAFVL
jgi:hypothetical protein